MVHSFRLLLRIPDMNTQPLSTKDPVDVAKFDRLAELWRYVDLLELAIGA